MSERNKDLFIFWGAAAIIVIATFVFIWIRNKTPVVQEEKVGALQIFTGPQGGTGIGTTTAGNIGNCLTVSSINPLIYTFAACSGGGGAGFGEAWQLFSNKSWLAPTTTVGIIVNASSTIGAGTNTTGLTISGGSTTTGSVYFTGLTGSTGGLGIDANNRVFKSATTTFSTGLTYSNGNVTCDTASASVFGCLSAVKFSQFNSATSTFTWPLIYTNATNAVTWGGLSTTSALAAGAAVLYATGVNTVASAATGTVSCSSGISCTSFNAISSGNISITNTGLLSYDAWTHPASGISATTSGMIFTAASSSIYALSVQNGTTTSATSTTLYVSGGATILGSSTFAGNATTTGTNFATNASSTKLWGANLSQCNGANQALNWSAGLFTCATISASGSVGNWFTADTWGTLTPNSTSTLVWFKSGIIASTTAIFDNSTTTNATTTSLGVTSLKVGGDNPITDITGTGLSISAGALTNTGLLSITGTEPIFFTTASGAVTTTFNRDWIVAGAGTYLKATTTLGIILSASSTIGGGNQAGGLTVSGGATTTGDAYILGNASTTNLRASGLTTSKGLTITTGGNIALVPTSKINFNTGSSYNTASAPDIGWNVASIATAGINNPSGNILQFMSGSTEVLRLATANTSGFSSSTPFAKLSIHGNANDAVLQTSLFAIGSSTASATTTLFLIDNMGSTTMAGPIYNTSTATSTWGNNGINLGAGCFSIRGTCIGSGAGSGTVTSVALSLPTGFSVTGSPVTTSGTLTATLSPGFSIRQLPSWTVGASGADYTTIQNALNECGAVGGGNIYLTDPTYAQGGTGITFKGSNCHIQGRGVGTTTITFTGATTLFKTNSAAGQYSNNSIERVTITGDSNASGIAFDLSDMSHFHLADTDTNAVGTWIKYDDTQNISFYNVFERNQATGLVSFGINASSTNPWNGNTFRDNFIGCGANNCVELQMTNANGNKFQDNAFEPDLTKTGITSIKIFDNNIATCNGVFNNVFDNNYIEGATLAGDFGISIAKGLCANGGIQRNRFSNNTNENHKTDYLFPGAATSTVISLQTWDNNYDSNFGNPLTSFQGPFGVATSSQLADVNNLTYSFFGISPQGGISSNEFVIGSSSATHVLVNNKGWFGLATTSPGAIFSAVGDALITGIVRGARLIITGIAAAFTPSIEGEIGIDTTDSQIKFYSNAATRVIPSNYYSSFSVATSTTWTGTTTVSLGIANTNETWVVVRCKTNTGTLNVSFNDGSNRMNIINASTTVGTTTMSTNNGIFDNAVERLVDIGTPASSPTRIGCTVTKTYDPT